MKSNSIKVEINNSIFPLIIKIVVSVLIFYFAYALFFYVIQRNIIFPVEFARPPHGISEQIPDSLKIWLTTEHGRTETWFLPPFKLYKEIPYPLVIIGHGNGDVIDRWVNVVTGLRKIGIGVLLIEYPGYGRSDGSPSQESIARVFTAGYDSIISNPEIDKNKIILLGQSIGGGAVCALTEKRPSATMILISTFTETAVLASDYLLPKFLIKDTFDNLSAVSVYNGPILYIHAEDDELIPFKESEKLLASSKNGRLIQLSGGHNMIRNWDEIWEKYVIPFLIENKILQ